MGAAGGTRDTVSQPPSRRLQFTAGGVGLGGPFGLRGLMWGGLTSGVLGTLMGRAMLRSIPLVRACLIGLTAAVGCGVGGGCIRVKVDPIYAKVDVNLKIDRSLDEFYSFQQPAGGATTAPTPGGPAVVVPEPTTVPVVPPTTPMPEGVR